MPTQTMGRKPEPGPEQVLEARLVLGLHRVLDLGDAGVQVDVLALDVGEDLLGVGVAADRDEEARRLGDGEGEQPVQDGRDDHHAEHDLPGLKAR